MLPYATLDNNLKSDILKPNLSWTIAWELTNLKVQAKVKRIDEIKDPFKRAGTWVETSTRALERVF